MVGSRDVASGPGSAPETVMRFVSELDQRVRSVVGDQLAATILHGSSALGGFIARRSDVDVLMLFDPPDVSTQRLRALAEQLRLTADRCPGVGLELSIVSSSAAACPAPPWPYLLHVATQFGDVKTVFGHDQDGDPDLLMHYAVCRVAGIVIAGHPANELIGGVEHRLILEYLTHELVWATEHADPTYGVVNACRAWRYVVTGELVSKLDGAAWVLSRVGPSAVIEDAIAAQAGSADGPSRQAADRLIAAVHDVIAGATDG